MSTSSKERLDALNTLLANRPFAERLNQITEHLSGDDKAFIWLSLVECHSIGAEHAAELERLLEKTTDALASATEHISEDLQPEFEKLAEEGKLSWPDAWSSTPYDESQAAMRLATWWHGAGTEELLAEAREALGQSTTDSD